MASRKVAKSRKSKSRKTPRSVKSRKGSKKSSRIYCDDAKQKCFRVRKGEKNYLKAWNSPSAKCVLQTTKKYLSRKSPAYPANECCGKIKRGNDGEEYVSTKSGKQRFCTWKKMKDSE